MTILRKVYYAIFNKSKVIIKKPSALYGYKWILDENYGRAYFKGYYEPELTKYICESLNEESCFLDIGSHAGYFSLLASAIAKKGQIVCFEPDQNNYTFLQSIKKINNVSNWTTINAAVGEEDGELRFKTGASSSTGFVADDGDLVVKQISLDSFIGTMNMNRIDLIKIDVEGFGANVLRGGIDVIKKFQPKILLECHLGSNEFSVAWELLNNMYDFYDFSNMNLIKKNTTEQIDFVILKAKNH